MFRSRLPVSHPSATRAGFSLIELLVVLAVAAILAGVAVPSYQHHILKARRADGQAALMAIALAQEQFRAYCSHYAGQLGATRDCAGDASILALPARSPQGYYRLAIEQADPAGYTALAAALDGQTRDRAHGVACARLTLDQDGRKTPPECWR